MDRALLKTVLPDDVMPWKYRKLLTNTGNAFQALFGQPKGMGRLVRAAEAEGRNVLDAAGISYTSDEEEAAARAESFEVRPVPGMDGVLGGSTWQSLSRGTGNVETDYLNGEIRPDRPATRPRGTDQRPSGWPSAAPRGPGTMTLEELTGILEPWLPLPDFVALIVFGRLLPGVSASSAREFRESLPAAQ